MRSYTDMIGIYIRTFFKGIKIGQDVQGNKYYIERIFLHKFKDCKPRRWVIYEGLPEASKVSPQWHAWLHYGTNTPPSTNDLRYCWQKPHLPNLTGTKFAYLPPGQRLKKANINKPYEAWSPK